MSFISGIHIGGNTESVSTGRTDEANVGEPGVTPSDTGFFRALIQARAMKLEAQEKQSRSDSQILNPTASLLKPVHGLVAETL